MGHVFFLVGFFGGFFELNKEKQVSMWVFHSTFVFLGKIVWVRKRRSILMYIFGRSNPKWIIFHLPWSRNDQKNISGNFVYIDPEGKIYGKSWYLFRFSWQDVELTVGVFTSPKVSNMYNMFSLWDLPSLKTNSLPPFKNWWDWKTAEGILVEMVPNAFLFRGQICC